jgi:hypothetical protein
MDCVFVLCVRKLFLCSTPWRRMGDWRYSSTILDLCTRWRWVVSFTPRPLYLREKRCRYLLDRRLGTVEYSKSLATGGNMIILLLFQWIKAQPFIAVLNSSRYEPERRSQWPRGVRHELSSLARMLGSWVRIPLKAWMSVCFYSVFVLFFVKVAALRQADPPLKESYRLYIGLRNWKSGQGPTKRTVEPWIYRQMDELEWNAVGTSSGSAADWYQKTRRWKC